MSLLGDTPFLNQLRESTGVLTENVANTDTTQIKSLFGNYNPNAASDYVFGPMGGIAQNQFDANQFELPYQPGEFTTFGGQFGSGGFNQNTGFNLPYNPAPYNPGFFNEYGNVAQTGNIPSNVSTTTTMNDREGRSGERGSFGNQDNISTEFVGNRGYRIGGDGRVEELDPESLDYKFNKFAFDALNLAKINPLNPLGYIDNMSQRLDPDIMSQIQGFESNNPQSLTFGPGIAQAVQNVFGGTGDGPLGGLTENDIQNFTGAVPRGLLSRPVNMNPETDLSLPTPTTVADLIGMTQGLNTGGGSPDSNPGGTGSDGGESQSQGQYGGDGSRLGR